VARHFGVAAPNRTYIQPERVSWYFDHDPDTLFRYALDDVRETRAISDILSPSYVVQAQIFPLSYQNTILRGNATKIDLLFLREYLRQRHAVHTRPGSAAASAPDGPLRAVDTCKRRGRLLEAIELLHQWAKLSQSCVYFLAFVIQEIGH
jgi:hypothetical protein